jgi:hypothetical protein
MSTETIRTIKTLEECFEKGTITKGALEKCNSRDEQSRLANEYCNPTASSLYHVSWSVWFYVEQPEAPTEMFIVKTDDGSVYFIVFDDMRQILTALMCKLFY